MDVAMTNVVCSITIVDAHRVHVRVALTMEDEASPEVRARDYDQGQSGPLADEPLATEARGQPPRTLPGGATAEATAARPYLLAVLGTSGPKNGAAPSVEPRPTLVQRPAARSELPPVDEFSVGQPIPLGETRSPTKPVAPPGETPDWGAPHCSVIEWISSGVVLASQGQPDPDAREQAMATTAKEPSLRPQPRAHRVSMRSCKRESSARTPTTKTPRGGGPKLLSCMAALAAASMLVFFMSGSSYLSATRSAPAVYAGAPATALIHRLTQC